MAAALTCDASPKLQEVKKWNLDWLHNSLHCVMALPEGRPRRPGLQKSCTQGRDQTLRAPIMVCSYRNIAGGVVDFSVYTRYCEPSPRLGALQNSCISARIR